MLRQNKNIKMTLMFIVIGLFVIMTIHHFVLYHEFSELIYNLAVLSILVYMTINWFLEERAANNVFSDLIEKISDGVMISDSNDMIKSVNSAFKSISGYREKELIGKKNNIFKSGRHDKDFYKKMWETLKNGKSWRGEIWNKRKNGEIIPQEAIIFPISSGNSKEMEFLSIWKDIREKKLKEEEEKKHLQIMEMTSRILSLTFEKKSLKEILQKALEIVLDAQWLSTHKEGCIFVTDEESQTLKIMASVSVGKFLIRNYANIPKGRCLCGKVYESGRAIFKSHIDEDHQNKYEGIKDHGHYIVPISIYGRVLGILNIYTKVGYIQTKTDLDFLTVVSDLLAQIIYKTKLNDRILALKEVDGKMASIRDTKMHYAFLLDEICRVTGWGLGEIWRPDMERRHLYRFAYSSKKGDSCEFALGSRDLKFKKGEDIAGMAWESGKFVWIKNMSENKQITRKKLASDCKVKFGFSFPIIMSGEIFVILNFFSQDVRYEDEDLINHVAETFTKIGMSLRQNMIFDQLTQSQKMEAMGSLAAGVAHDFNNIIGAILGYCEILIPNLKEKPQELSDVVEIKIAAEKAGGIIKQLLTFSRAKPSVKSVINVNNSVRELSGMLRKIIGINIELELSLDDNAGKISIDPSQFDQILMNISINAKDAISGKGKVKIDTGEVDFLEENSPVSLPPGKYCFISISDNGKGMDDFLKDKIFMPFFTTKEKGKGTGIGLSVVYSVVRQNNAELTVESKLGEGTKFNFYFPKVSS